MTNKQNEKLSFDDFDEMNSPKPEASDFEGVVDRMLSRRNFLRGALKIGAGSMVVGLGGLSLTGCDDNDSTPTQTPPTLVLQTFMAK